MKRGKANSDNSSESSSSILSTSAYNKPSSKRPLVDRLLALLAGEPRKPRILTNFGYVDPEVVERMGNKGRGL
jgi:hypothetical protein